MDEPSLEPLEKGWISKRSKNDSKFGKLSIMQTEEPEAVNLSESGSFREGLLHISQQGTTIHSSRSAMSTATDTSPASSRSTTSAKRPQSSEDVRFELSQSDFENMEIIGKGSSGYVRKALRRSTNEVMALKVINVFEEEKRKQMMQEVIMMCDSMHDALIRFHGAFFYEGTISVALEYMTAGSVADVVKIAGKIPEPVLACMAEQIADGMSFMHEKKQVHRDFKPCNLLMDHSGKVKITDFGVAAELDSSLVKCTTFVGTYLYMSPERFGSEPYSFPSDVWSFGLTMIECATGEYPYLRNSGKTYWELMDAIIKCDAPSIESSEGYSSDLSDFAAACLHKEPKDRAVAATLKKHPFVSSHCGTLTVEDKRKRVAEWLGTVRSCFVSGNMPSSTNFNTKELCNNFCGFFMSYFLPKRRPLLWSLYNDDSVMEHGDDVCKGRDEIMTKMMNIPMHLELGEISNMSDCVSYDEAARTVNISVPVVVRHIRTAGRGRAGEAVSVEYHGEVEHASASFSILPNSDTRCYTIVKQTLPKI